MGHEAAAAGAPGALPRGQDWARASPVRAQVAAGLPLLPWRSKHPLKRCRQGPLLASHPEQRRCIDAACRLLEFSRGAQAASKEGHAVPGVPVCLGRTKMAALPSHPKPGRCNMGYILRQSLHAPSCAAPRLLRLHPTALQTSAQPVCCSCIHSGGPGSQGRWQQG